MIDDGIEGFAASKVVLYSGAQEAQSFPRRRESVNMPQIRPFSWPNHEEVKRFGEEEASINSVHRLR
jgi:hypothetical protein